MDFKYLKLTSAVLGALALASCSSSNNQELVNYITGNESQLYNTAVQDLNDHSFSKANSVLTQLSLQYPFGNYKDQVAVGLAYTAYEQGNYQQAASQVNQYIANSATGVPAYGDYALLIHALSAIESNRGIFQKLFNTNPADTDLSGLETALSDVEVILTSYPDSPYHAYAKQLDDYLTNILAAHNLDVAKFYIKYNDPVAAYRRANIVVVNYADTVFAKQAVNVMETAAKQLNLPAERATEIQDIKDKLANIQVRPQILEFPKPGDLTPPFLAADLAKANAAAAPEAQPADAKAADTKAKK